MAAHTLRPKLLTATIVALLLGVGAFAWILGLSMKPTESLALSHRLEVDLSRLAPGDIQRIDWEGFDVFVLRRTPEQITWLKSHSPPVLESGRLDEVPSADFKNPFRSLSPEYFVAQVRKSGVTWTVHENQSQVYGCDDFRYSATPIPVSAQVIFPGGFYCANAYREMPTDFTHWPFVYDPAGRSPSPWYQPLSVPPHSLRGETLVLSPEG